MHINSLEFLAKNFGLMSRLDSIHDQHIRIQYDNDFMDKVHGRMPFGRMWSNCENDMGMGYWP